MSDFVISSSGLAPKCGRKCATICASRFRADFSGVYVLRYTAHHSAKLGIVLFHPCTPARMSSSISLARRSAAFLSANPVDSRYSWPLIILRRYQTSPRFTKAILDLLLEPAVERQAIESQKATVANEWQLLARHLVVQSMWSHADVLRGRVD